MEDLRSQPRGKRWWATALYANAMLAIVSFMVGLLGIIPWRYANGLIVACGLLVVWILSTRLSSKP
jgi:hypothetical protein